MLVAERLPPCQEYIYTYVLNLFSTRRRESIGLDHLVWRYPAAEAIHIRGGVAVPERACCDRAPGRRAPNLVARRQRQAPSPLRHAPHRSRSTPAVDWPAKEVNISCPTVTNCNLPSCFNALEIRHRRRPENYDFPKQPAKIVPNTGFLAFDIRFLTDHSVEPAGLFYCGIVHDRSRGYVRKHPLVCDGWCLVLKE